MRSPDLNDVLVVAGLAIFAYGLYLIWPPLAPIAIGAAFMAAGLFGASIKGIRR